jgi:FkbM family methyltransferase
MTAAWNLSEIIKDMPRPATIIDAGANNSQMTRLLQLICEPGARVLSFEPIPSLKPIGERYYQALSDNDGSAEFYVPGGSDDELGSLYKDYFESANVGAKTLKVETARFDTLVKQGKVPWAALKGPILLKIDTEGSELNVMKGFGEYLAKVDYVVTEVSNGYGRGKPYDLVEMCRCMDAAGFVNSQVIYSCFDGATLPAYLDMVFWRGNVLTRQGLLRF